MTQPCTRTSPPPGPRQLSAAATPRSGHHRLAWPPRGTQSLCHSPPRPSRRSALSPTTSSCGHSPFSLLLPHCLRLSDCREWSVRQMGFWYVGSLSWRSGGVYKDGGSVDSPPFSSAAAWLFWFILHFILNGILMYQILPCHIFYLYLIPFVIILIYFSKIINFNSYYMLDHREINSVWLNFTFTLNYCVRQWLNWSIRFAWLWVFIIIFVKSVCRGATFL